jgi:hypothetical protein
MTDSVSLRFDYLVPEIVVTKAGRKLASGYKLVRIVRAHRCGVDDFDGLFGRDPNRLADMFREGLEKKLQQEYGEWPVRFRGVSLMRHPWNTNPTMDDPNWI